MAAVFSLVLPGIGQFYNRQQTKGLVLLGSCAALLALTAWLSGLSRITVALALAVVWISAATDAYMTAKMGGRPLDWYYRKPYVVAMLLLIGPVALPLLWRSPHFARPGKWGWTALVLGVVLIFLATPYLLHALLQQMPQLQALLRQSGVAP